jgi:hypothetical protein
MYRGQVASKIMLIRALEQLDTIAKPVVRRPLNIAICGGWYGVLPRMMIDLSTVLVPWYVRVIDNDPNCSWPAVYLNEALNPRSYKFRFDCRSMLETRYLEDMVINTSLEHLSTDELGRWFDLIQPGTIVAMQGNSSTEPDHPNPIMSFDDFPNKNFEELHRDSLLMYNDSIRRMIIGVKR